MNDHIVNGKSLILIRSSDKFLRTTSGKKIIENNFKYRVNIMKCVNVNM